MMQCASVFLLLFVIEWACVGWGKKHVFVAGAVWALIATCIGGGFGIPLYHGNDAVLQGILMVVGVCSLIGIGALGRETFRWGIAALVCFGTTTTLWWLLVLCALAATWGVGQLLYEKTLKTTVGFFCIVVAQMRLTAVWRMVVGERTMPPKRLSFYGVAALAGGIVLFWRHFEKGG